jgi:hypothetical protein
MATRRKPCVMHGQVQGMQTLRKIGCAAVQSPGHARAFLLCAIRMGGG